MEVWRNTNPSKRTDSVAAENVNIPFRVYIPAGHSTFTVAIPAEFTDRKYYFSNVVLLSQFYSDQAADMELDTDDELNQVLSFPLHVKMNLFDITQPFYGNFYTPDTSVVTTDLLAKGINAYYEINKPKGLYRLGCVFDWTDGRFNPHLERWDQFVKWMAPDYYDEDFDITKHFNALPVSARNLQGVNNYLYPTDLNDLSVESLRFCMNLAPNANLTFSNKQFLIDLGFSDETQIPIANSKNQYVYKNPSKSSFMRLIADNPAVINLSKKPSVLKVRMQVIATNYFSEPVLVQVTIRQSLKNDNFAAAIKTVLLDIADKENLQFNISYNKVTKVFDFSFPINDKIINPTIVVGAELAERLGFGLINDITLANKTGLPVNDKLDDALVQEKSRALAYDTGVVIITDENKSTRFTSQVPTKYMSSLYPTGMGTLEIQASDLCQTMPTADLTETGIILTEKGNVYPCFKLWRFLDNNELVPLVWIVGAFINGVLRGINPSIK